MTMDKPPPLEYPGHATIKAERGHPRSQESLAWFLGRDASVREIVQEMVTGNKNTPLPEIDPDSRELIHYLFLLAEENEASLASILEKICELYSSRKRRIDKDELADISVPSPSEVLALMQGVKDIGNYQAQTPEERAELFRQKISILTALREKLMKYLEVMKKLSLGEALRRDIERIFENPESVLSDQTFPVMKLHDRLVRFCKSVESRKRDSSSLEAINWPCGPIAMLALVIREQFVAEGMPSDEAEKRAARALPHFVVKIESSNLESEKPSGDSRIPRLVHTLFPQEDADIVLQKYPLLEGLDKKSSVSELREALNGVTTPYLIALARTLEGEPQKLSKRERKYLQDLVWNIEDLIAERMGEEILDLMKGGKKFLEAVTHQISGYRHLQKSIVDDNGIVLEDIKKRVMSASRRAAEGRDAKKGEGGESFGGKVARATRDGVKGMIEGLRGRLHEAPPPRPKDGKVREGS